VLRLRLCPTGKFAYAVEPLARRALKESRRVPPQWHRKGRAPVALYHCGECGMWHLTGMRPEVYGARVLSQTVVQVTAHIVRSAVDDNCQQ
jgi:hypothetical protein